MILSAQSIRKRCTPPLKSQEKPLINPFVERGVVNGRSFGLSCAGYDICLDKVMIESAGRRLNSYCEAYNGDWQLVIRPGDFVLASSIERIEMPNDLLCIVHDKSTWAREGLALQNTVLEPGWCGHITLELSVHGPGPILIRSGDPIAQLIFHKLDEPTEYPYRGKYQNQEAMPIAAILETPDD